MKFNRIYHERERFQLKDLNAADSVGSVKISGKLNEINLIRNLFQK